MADKILIGALLLMSLFLIVAAVFWNTLASPWARFQRWRERRRQ